VPSADIHTPSQVSSEQISLLIPYSRFMEHVSVSRYSSDMTYTKLDLGSALHHVYAFIEMRLWYIDILSLAYVRLLMSLEAQVNSNDLILCD